MVVALVLVGGVANLSALLRARDVLRALGTAEPTPPTRRLPPPKTRTPTANPPLHLAHPSPARAA